MKVELREITSDNFDPVVKLKVGPGQEDFVATNVYSIAESKVWPNLRPWAIYADDELVGFAMYGKTTKSGNCWIARLMLDEKHQNKGYGRAAMGLIIERMRQEYQPDRILISFNPENHVARRLYESLGFVDDHRVVDGELVFRLDLTN